MVGKSNEKLRQIPSVSAILENPETKELIDHWSFKYVSYIVKREISRIRGEAAKTRNIPSTAEIVAGIKSIFARKQADIIKPVINATGVVLHTNLGRAPIGNSIMRGVYDISRGYCNLEFDTINGKRSKRGELAGELAAVLAGAESGLIVNNCAAAVLMIVTCFAHNKEVVVSRGELVQIGGGFRIPEIITASGAKLKEVGTTNRTTLNDYAKNINKNTGLILKVHLSNFRMEGFTEETTPSELASLAHKNRLPMLFDLGSGMYDDYGISAFENEPDIESAVRSGASLVSFSGDKLFGGPQAGIIVGKAKYISLMQKYPLYRAIRPDKMNLCAIEQTLLAHLKNPEKIRLHEIFKADIETLRARAIAICAELGDHLVSHGPMKSVAGGGSTPAIDFDGYGLTVKANIPDLEKKLRLNDPPIIVRTLKGKVILNMTTILPEQDIAVLKALKACLS
ncbi:MAG: L-seryl-tRNA(Sec) selenium transferase [candidate division Zixibacteria bacterium]|nr:L-seryl-tRNA(Sec) selenium transferase [candidate division Zixibacteria bacterium]